MPREAALFDSTELLFKAPLWISAANGVIAFTALRWGVSAWAGSGNLHQLAVQDRFLLEK